ncbi:EAL domain-containing protein [Ancylothrix sp. C2]|uniref:EAL domain-containing protein n=1 Tax=Ancylothrix sp. D3o TaxID=2953691 RepID=UPI0021BBB395|nr:EAL domain-containing protein [Ancylothrix sp. D3o]MCT7949849.1 EAL domain-containing protein [Ancylothrix sp. D3o]
MTAINGNGEGCARCETIPSKIEGSGRLYLWFPVKHTLNKILSFLKNQQLTYHLQEEKCLYIILDKESKEWFLNVLSAKLSSKELKESQALWMPNLEEAQFKDFSRVVSLQNFLSLGQSDWLLDMLANERITSYFQPIVYTEDTSQIFAYEALLRGIDENNSVIAPGRIFAQAESAGLIFQLDALARSSAIKQGSLHGIKEHLFINFSPTSVYDPTTCLRMTVRAIDEADFSHERIVFEVAESEQPPDISHLTKILKFYQDAGFLIALDDFGSGYSNLNLIHQLRPDFVKLDMHLIRNVHQDPYKALITEKLLEIAHQLEIKTIAEGIETEEELHWLRERGTTFVQGFLIAKPSTPPVATTPKFSEKMVALPA